MASPETTVPDSEPIEAPVETIDIGTPVISADGFLGTVTLREVDDFGQYTVVCKVNGRLRLYGPYDPGTLIRIATAEEVAEQESENLRRGVVKAINTLSHAINNGHIPLSLDNPMAFTTHLDDFAQLVAIAESLGVKIRASNTYSDTPSKYARVTWPTGGPVRGFYCEWSAMNPDYVELDPK